MVRGLRSELSGREALSVIDRAARSAREALSVAMNAADKIETDRARLAEARVKEIRALAALRVDLLRQGESGVDLDDAERRAIDLLKEQEEFIERAAANIAKVDEEISNLEDARDAAATARQDAIDAHADKVADVEEALRDDPKYQGLVKAAEDASAISARAEQKLELAETDRDEKGEPYEADPLFSYLWKRKYRTPSYKAGAFFRFLDGWVARLCKYDRHYANYNRLIELPERLAEHVERVEAAEAKAIEALEAAESKALDNAKISEFLAAIEDAVDKVQELDERLTAAEARHLKAIKDHEDARDDRTGPVQHAREVLEIELNRASFPDLRVLASETLTLDDDRIVDRLVKLRSDELALEVSAEDIGALPKDRRLELERLETMRRRFKSERLDRHEILLSGAVLSRVLDGMQRGDLRSDEAVRTIKRSAKRRPARTPRHFGGSRGRRTSGLPDIITDVLIEAAKQAGRSKGIDFGGGPWGGHTKGRRTSFPRPKSVPRSRPSRRRGGFKTGGGF